MKRKKNVLNYLTCLNMDIDKYCAPLESLSCVMCNCVGSVVNKKGSLLPLCKKCSYKDMKRYKYVYDDVCFDDKALSSFYTNIPECKGSCLFCESETAEFYCFDCGSNFCESHNQKHIEKSKHNTRRLSEINKELNCLCNKHPQRYLSKVKVNQKMELIYECPECLGPESLVEDLVEKKSFEENEIDQSLYEILKTFQKEIFNEDVYNSFLSYSKKSLETSLIMKHQNPFPASTEIEKGNSLVIEHEPPKTRKMEFFFRKQHRTSAAKEYYENFFQKLLV